MKLFFPVFVFALLTAGFGCRSSREANQSSSSGDPKPSPSVVVQNASSIEAVIEHLDDLGGSQFNLKIFILTSSPVGGRTSILEAGQRIFASPRYYADSSGKVNFEDARNKRMLGLKQLQTGESFKGKVALDRYSTWNIIDVEEKK